MRFSLKPVQTASCFLHKSALKGPLCLPSRSAQGPYKACSREVLHQVCTKLGQSLSRARSLYRVELVQGFCIKHGLQRRTFILYIFKYIQYMPTLNKVSASVPNSHTDDLRIGHLMGQSLSEGEIPGAVLVG